MFNDISLDELRRRNSYKWRTFPPDVLPSFVAEMDFALAPAVRDALAAAVSAGDTGYAWQSDELGRAFADFAKARLDWGVDPSGVIVLPDVMSGIIELLRHALQPGDGVVINPPVYPPFFSHIAEAGCRVVEAPLARSDRGYALDFDALERAFAGGARVYLLSNPHNPTGRVFSRADLERIIELAQRYEVLVFSDEIHAPLALPGAQHTPLLALGEQAAQRTIAFVSATKAWNIPGLKCAQAVVASDAMRRFAAPLSSLDFLSRAGNFGIIGSIAAYREGVDWLDELIVALDHRRGLLGELLAELIPAARYLPPEGGYLAWVDCTALPMKGEPADFFLERGRVALGSGPHFGTGGGGHVRITMATSAAILREIVERMRKAVAYDGSI
jgi:cystathionine beta-lyase